MGRYCNWSTGPRALIRAAGKNDTLRHHNRPVSVMSCKPSYTNSILTHCAPILAFPVDSSYTIPMFNMLGSYEKLPANETDLNSDEDTIISTKRSLLHCSCTPLSSLWPYVRIILLATCAAGWLTAIAITWTTSKDLIRIPEQGFIPGGNLSVPGYGMVYSDDYCNGWADPEGARRRGCILDSMQGGWIHELCTNPELLEEWTAMPDFGWYLDEERTQRIPQSQVYAGNVE